MSVVFLSFFCSEFAAHTYLTELKNQNHSHAAALCIDEAAVMQ